MLLLVVQDIPSAVYYTALGRYSKRPWVYPVPPQSLDVNLYLKLQAEKAYIVAIALVELVCILVNHQRLVMHFHATDASIVTCITNSPNAVW